MKKVSFEAKRPSTQASTSFDNWVTGKGSQTEPMKRLTTPIPLSLHQRLKSRCAMQNANMADVVRQLLEERFPASTDTERDATA